MKGFQGPGQRLDSSDLVLGNAAAPQDFVIATVSVQGRSARVALRRGLGAPLAPGLELLIQKSGEAIGYDQGLGCALPRCIGVTFGDERGKCGELDLTGVARLLDFLLE